LENLTTQLNDKHFGPMMVIEAVCPYTKKTFKTPIDWTFDNFFGISSPSLG
jgi:hypothetical protein